MIPLALPGSGEQGNERAPNSRNGQGRPMFRKSSHQPRISSAAYMHIYNPPPIHSDSTVPLVSLDRREPFEILLSPFL